MPFVYVNMNYSVQAAYITYNYVNNGEPGMSGEPGELGEPGKDSGIVDVNHKIYITANQVQRGANGPNGKNGKGGKNHYWVKTVNTHKYDHRRGRWVNNPLPLDPTVYTVCDTPVTYAPSGSSCAIN